MRNEPGCLIFQATTRADNPAEFVVYEEYKDEAAQEVSVCFAFPLSLCRVSFADVRSRSGHGQAHRNMEHGAVFNAKLGELIEGDGSVLFRLDPVAK